MRAEVEGSGSMGLRAAVAGASGYAGGELLRLLLGHPELEVGPIAAGGNAGRPVGAVHPQLPSLAHRTFTTADPEPLAGADVVFLALPHGESATLASRLPADVVVVDLGADFRLEDPQAWERYYGGPHAGTWAYGLPELPGARERLQGARRIANPGCYPTSVNLALSPLLAAGLVEPGDVVVVAASGTSGAGRSPKAHLLGTEVMGDLSPYKVGGSHQHIPEIVQTLSSAAGTAVTLSFTPVLAPMPRGILATCTARLADGVTTADLRTAMDKAYADEPFVHLLAEGLWPHTAATAGSNSCHLQVVADHDSGRAVVVSAIDNLALELPETAGLSAEGVAP